MNLELLQTACLALKSSKLMERKKGAEAILELISENDDICRSLDYNSMNKDRDKDKLTWTGIFNDVRDYFAKETEKLTPNQAGSVPKTFVYSLVERVFQKGTCHRPWIHWVKILDFVSGFLSQEVHAIVYGPSLISMLQRFLSIELYVSIVDAATWTTLIKLLLKVYDKYNIPTLTILGCLNIAIQEGSNHPGVIGTLRTDVVRFYENVFSSERIRNRSHVVFFLRGVSSLCRRNAVEFRGILCKLGETIIPNVISSNIYIAEEEAAIVEFLLVQLQLHTPCDVSIKSVAFYANDSKKWQEILRSIYSFCLDTIEEIATKKLSHFHKELQVSERLILLAAKCTKQIFDSQTEDHTSSGEEDEPNPVKKPMRFRSFNNLLCDISSRSIPSESSIVWMNYFTAVLIDFPNLVSGRMNYSSIFTFGLSFLNSSFVTRKEVYIFFLCLLKTEKFLIATDALKTRSKLWEHVWDITLRSLSINGSKSEALELLRNLLIEVQPSNVNSLLILYVNGSMPVSPPSLHLLAEYLSRCSLPLYMGSTVGESLGNNSANVGVEIASTICPRLSLIRWLVNSQDEPELGYEPLISSILCSLLVRQSHNLIYAERFCHRPNSCIKIPSELSQYEVEHDDFEKIIVNYTFIHIPMEKSTEIEETSAQESLILSLVPIAPGRLVEALQSDFEKLPLFDHSCSDFIKKFVQLNYRVSVYLSILNVLEKHSIGSGDALGFKTNLEKLFDKALSKYMEAAIDFMNKGKEKSASQIQEVISIMRNLLRSSHLCDKIKALLSQRFPQQMQELLKKVYRSNLIRYIERAANNIGDTSVMFGGQDLGARLYGSSSGTAGDNSGISECRQIELAAIEGLNCLVDYGIICDHRIDLFTDILKDCLCESHNTAISYIFEFSAELVSRLIPVLDSGNCSELLTTVISLLQKMCRGYFQVPHCSVRLWELFADITKVTAQDNDLNKKNLMILVGTLSGFMKSGNAHGSSISVCQAGFRALTEIAKNDPNLSWSVFTPKNGFPLLVLHEVYEFLNNASQQIRLFAADTLCLSFKYAAPPTQTSTNSQEVGSSITEPIDKKAEYYEKIYHFLYKTFNVPTNLKPEEITEEAVNRTCLAVSCLTRLIFAYPFIQKKSLFFLLRLQMSKKIEVSLVNLALNYISPTAAKTMSCYVSYLLQQWMLLTYKIEDFPFSFFGCETMGAFYGQFRKEISVEFFQKNDMDGLSKFAQYFSLESLDLIKECYGMLIARTVPGLSVYPSRHAIPPRDSEIVSQLKETQKRLTSALGGQSQTESLMMTSLGDVVLQMVSLVFDPLIPSAWGCPDIRLPEPAPPFHDESWIDSSLNFLKEASSRKDISIVAFLATYSAKSIYDTLLILITRVHNAHDALEKFWRLHQFSYFVKQLLQEPQMIFNQMKEYVCQFVVYAYLRLLNSEIGEDTYSKYLRHALIYLISKLVLVLTLSYKDEMKQYYYPIVNGLISSAIRFPDLIEPAKKPLDLLLKNYVDDYADCIVSLDPFPSHIDAFAEYREIYLQMKYGQRRAEWPLQKELRSCLTEIQASHGSCTKERLEFLRDILSKKKKDLERLVRNLEGKQFSDDCTNDLLHNLIHMLVGLIKSGEDEEVTWEACRCLGEIGPVDLHVLVLPDCPSRKEIRKMVSSITTVVEIAAEYLKSDDIQVVATTGEVLRSVCHMGECAELLSKEMAKTRLEAILKPFKSSKPSNKSNEKVFASELEAKLGLNEMNEFIDYPTWITQLTCGLIGCLKIEDSLTARLLPLCKLKVEFCQQILPFVVYVILYAGRTNPLVRKALSGYFRNFFGKFVHGQTPIAESVRSFTPIMGAQQLSIYLNKLALRSLLGVIQFLRNHQAPQEFKGSVKLTPWDNNLWLEVNYQELAKAAQYCGAYLTSILYTEIAATDLEMGGPGHLDDNGDEEFESFYSQGTALFPRHRGETFEKLLLKAYTSIGEPDAVYGCGSARYSDGHMNIRHLQQRMQYGRVLSACDGNAADPESSIEIGVCSSMKEMGLYNTLWTYLKGIETRETVLDQDLAEIQYECGWRLSKWNLHCDKATYVKDGSLSQSGKGHGLLQRYIYESAQTGIASDMVNHIENVKRGYTSVAKDLRHASIESSENLYGFLSQFQMLRVVEDFFHIETVGSGSISEFLHKWKMQDRISVSDFKFQEPVLYLRSILVRSYGEMHPRIELENAYDDCMLELLSKARDTGRLGFAENCAACLSASSDKSIKKDLEIAKNQWARGDEDIARHILSRLLKKSSPDGCDLYPVMLLLYGEWLSESMSERPSVILDKYLLRSCQIYEKRSGVSQAETSKAHFVLAKYADSQYRNVSKYVKSDFFTEKISHYEKAKTDVIASANAQDVDTRRSALVLRKQSYIDEEEIRATFEQRQKFLALALRHYLRGLKDSNDQDLLIFRAVALWLENADSGEPESCKAINTIFKQETMPSYKYLVVLHQLSARMNGNSKVMTDILTSILVKCAQQHPYHTMPVLLTQALLHKDQEIVRNTPYKKQLEDRVKAASKLVESIKRDRKLGQLALKMDKLWIALISLANYQESRGGNTGSANMPKDSQIRTMQELEGVAVPTTTVPVSIAGEYKDNIIGIQSFDFVYHLVGGINSPKRISCIGTNGAKFNMLLKGQDDLRQDAVMQQVFGVMNKLLIAENKTKARRLHVRTYKVVPLSQRSGILEWCENTQTFGDYLVNTENGAHQKYRPQDYSPHECRRKMLDVKDCGDNDKKYGNFMTIMEHFKPVFRHFFFENFKEAGTFFERRLAYTRSVATNSMVGYILGLGDRHVLNILIDNTTAELIHIDLGVAFEQGRILPTPETIPFRLTRDVVDGMGVSGVEGVFRKSCEMTLDVLRNNSEIILTILEVLLYDPLYMWTLTADRMKKVQPAENSRGPLNKRTNGNTSVDPVESPPNEGNSSAARVLLRLRQKLVGIEEGGSSGSMLSVPGHVSLLIQRALDPEKLSRLFPGWQPYL